MSSKLKKKRKKGSGSMFRKVKISNAAADSLTFPKLEFDADNHAAVTVCSQVYVRIICRLFGHHVILLWVLLCQCEWEKLNGMGLYVTKSVQPPWC